MGSKINDILNQPIEIIESWDKLNHTEHSEIYLKINKKAKDRLKSALLECVPEEIGEGDGWDIYFTNGKEKDGKVRPCCPGDDIAYAHNQARQQVLDNIERLFE